MFKNMSFFLFPVASSSESFRVNTLREASYMNYPYCFAFNTFLTRVKNAKELNSPFPLK
jgi:hypothetical protein